MSAHPNSIYLKLLDRLHNAGIAYAIIRDDPLAEKPLAELDLLIDPAFCRSFAAVAREHGFSQIRDGYLNPGKKVFLYYHGKRPALLDVHEKMIFRCLEFLDVKNLLQNRVQRGGYFFLSGEDYFLALLLHNILAKNEIQQKHRVVLLQLQQKKCDESRIESRLEKFGLLSVYRQIIPDFAAACDDPAIVRQWRKQVRKILRRQPVNLLRLLRLRFRLLKTRFWGKKRGLIIAFIGPDGAGKSSIIAALRQKLKQQGLSTKVAYMGPWGGSILKLRKIFFWLNPSPYRSDYKDFYAGKRKDKPCRLKGLQKWKFNFRCAVYYFFLLMEMKTRWIVRVLPALRRGQIVLADRYIYDILTGYKNRPMDYQQGIRKRICKKYPRPDIGVLLQCEPEIIFSRKSQLSHAQLEHSQQVYKEIAESFHFQILETSASIEDTVAGLEKTIIPAIREQMIKLV